MSEKIKRKKGKKGVGTEEGGVGRRRERKVDYSLQAYSIEMRKIGKEGEGFF